MKRWLVIGLVVVVVLTGVPILMPGMMGAACSACGPAHMASGADCVAMIAASLWAVALLMMRLRTRRVPTRALLFARALDPPPRLTLG